MPIAVKCRACGANFRLRDEMAGQTVRCKCGQPLSVPVPGNQLAGLLEEELSRPYERPPERKAPVYVPPVENTSDAAKTPSVNVIAGRIISDAPPPPPPNWVIGLRTTLRSIVGVLGLTYGLLMLGLGARAIWAFVLASIQFSVFQAPWWQVVYVMIGLCGLLLAVASVGVLIGRKEGALKARISSGILATLWLATSFLIATQLIHHRMDERRSLDGEFWLHLTRGAALILTWAIVPLAIYAWCRLAAKRDCPD
jgi:hypothetical protein